MWKERGDRKRKIKVEIPEFRAGRGEFVAVVGENGSGKSTLLDMLGLILVPDHADEFVLNGPPSTDLNSLSANEKIRLRREYFAYALQSGGLLEFLSIRENIRFAAQLKNKPQAKIDEIVKHLDLEDILDKRPGKTSGGQRQKAAIACALVQEPLVILADEPTSALDPGSAEKLMKTFRHMTGEAGISLIMVTHALQLVEGIADTIYRFHGEEQSSSLRRSVLISVQARDKAPDRDKPCSSGTADTLPF